MVSSRLFGHRQWLADRETFFAVHQRLIDLGLVERVPGKADTWQDTPLGKEVDVRLFEVFIGLIDVWDVLFILEDRCLIDEGEADEVSERMSRKANPESVLMGYVKRAYFDYRKASKFFTRHHLDQAHPDLAESGWPLPCAHPHARAREKSFKNFAGFHNLMTRLCSEAASLRLPKRVGNDRFGAALLEQIVQCLDRERLQGGVLVKGQLPQRS
jgi:hypothetical protein